MLVDALEDAPEDEDVNSSLHEECVDNNSICDRMNIDHKNRCSDSVSSKDDMTKLTVKSFNCKKSNGNVLTEARKTISELFPRLDHLGSEGARNEFELLLKSVA